MDSADLVVTLRFDPDNGLVDLAESLDGLRQQAADRGFAFDRHDAANELQATCFRWRVAAEVRLALAQSGAMAIFIAARP